MTELDTSLRGTTELRIHGVSGTPPESMLQHPHTELVAGDDKAGFYRRWFPARDSLDVPGRSHREAYSWGGLTSGSGARALWLLLLPFALVNLASWTEPGRPDEALGRRRLLEALLRLFALTLTLTVVLAIATMSMDLFAWQCAASDSRCAAQDGLAGWLADLGHPGRRLAAGAVVPALVIALLWYLGHRTWRDYERKVMPAEDARPADFSLADPRFWNGDLPVRRLRALHITAAWLLLTLLIVDPTRRFLDRVNHDATSLAITLETFAAVAGIGCLIGALLPWIADRQMSLRESAGPRESAAVWRWLPWTALAALLAAVALAAISDWSDWHSAGPLPLLSGLLHTGFAIQASLLLVLLLLNGSLPRERTPLVPVAMRGHALPLLATVGWLLAGGFAAGLAVRTANWLGTPVAVGDAVSRQRVLDSQVASADAALPAQISALDAPDPVLVPAPFTYVALVASVLVGVVVVLLAVVWFRVSKLTREHSADLERSRPNADPQRVHAVARSYALAALSDYAPRYLGRTVLVASALVLVGTLLYAINPSWPQQNLPLLTGFGSWAVGAAAVLLVALGRAAYRTPQLRRTVGILWDLASFWPRAAHPLAPPCYSERVLPDLVERAAALTREQEDRLLLSAHSQGTVIALAALLQMPAITARRTALLTYGSPLTRLYASFFPGYFNRAAYEAAMTHLGSEPSRTSSWPWRNLYRLSDPIGGWVLAPATPGGDVDDVDRQLVDPVFDRAEGDPAWPPTRGHSGYWQDEEFDVVSRRVLELRG